MTFLGIYEYLSMTTPLPPGLPGDSALEEVAAPPPPPV